MGQTAIGIDDSDDNAAAANSGPTDDDDLENWIPFFEDGQQPVSWDCDDFLDGVSEEFANTQNVDWDHPEIDDDYSEDNFVVEKTQSHRYESVYGNSVEIFNKEKIFNSDEWTCINHIICKKKFTISSVNFL